MPSEYRTEIINLARIANEYPYSSWRYVLGIVHQMESGLTLYEVISKADKRYANEHVEELDHIDRASAWIRVNSTKLELQLD